MVHLRLYSTLTKYLKGASIGEAVPVEVEAGTSVRDLIAKLGIAEGEVFLVSINSQVEAHDYILSEGDKVSLFGPIAGGCASR
ncbi:MAG: MoaD/ThiS family protein [Dehalococcoidia bacterium]|nr:MoaD/ThiS family protein [Dehalococcoidia bacterium]